MDIVKAHQAVIDYHFDEMIDWNIQTSMYAMLMNLISRMEPSYLTIMADLYNQDGNIDQITVQLEDVILDVLKDRKYKKEIK